MVSREKTAFGKKCNLDGRRFVINGLCTVKNTKRCVPGRAVCPPPHKIRSHHGGVSCTRRRMAKRERCTFLLHAMFSPIVPSFFHEKMEKFAIFGFSPPQSFPPRFHGGSSPMSNITPQSAPARICQGALAAPSCPCPMPMPVCLLTALTDRTPKISYETPQIHRFILELFPLCHDVRDTLIFQSRAV